MSLKGKPMMSPHDKSSLLHSLEKIKSFVEKLPIHTDCFSCFHLKEGICELCDETPPKEILLNGCKEYQFNPDSAPF